MTSVREHLIKYPNARTSTVRYMQQRDEMTKQLMREIHDEQARRTPKPWWSNIKPIWRWRWS